jgi:hypothetical protein
VTEADWLACADPAVMIAWLNKRDASARKFRLFSCACARSLWGLLSQDAAREAIQIAEAFADGLVTEAERRAAAKTLRSTFPPRMTPDFPVPAPYVADMVAYYCAWSNSVGPQPGVHLNEHGAESVCHWTRAATILDQTGLWTYPINHPLNVAGAVHQCRLLRDIFGNPFRPVSADPMWRGDTVLALAHSIYEDREFSALPVLADALEEAGCENEDLLGHCRSPGPHARGCWAVDLLRGRE